MAIKNISYETVIELLKKTTITTNDRFLLDSYTYTPLADFCNDIRPNELEKVRILEEKNLYRYINALSMILGIYGRETLMKVLITSPFCDMITELKNEYSGKEFEKSFIIVILKMILALKENGGNLFNGPVFEGQMPQKFMSFRNQTANEWFKNYVDTKIYILANIYEKASWEEAKAHLFANMAYQLHRCNPIKYNIDESLSMDDALRNILVKFIDEQGGDSSKIYNDNGEVISKVL